MNKKYLKYGVFAMALMLGKQSFTMYKLARLAGITALPAYGLYQANEADKHLQKSIKVTFVAEEFSREEAMALDDWFMATKKHVGVPNPELVSLGFAPYWSSRSGKVNAAVVTDPNVLLDLSWALVTKPEAEAELSEVLQAGADFRKKVGFAGDYNKYNKEDAKKIKRTLNHVDELVYECNKIIKACDKTIAEQTIILKHELGHIVHKDLYHTMYAVAAMPIGVEFVSFGVTSGLKKLFNISSPKKLVGTIFRSGCAVGAIIPKTLINVCLFAASIRHQEADADRFACEHAESRLELQEMENKCKMQVDDDKELLKTDPTMLSPTILSPYEFPKIVNQQYDFYGKKCLEKISQQLNSAQVSERKEEVLVNIAHAIVQPSHPYAGNRAKNVRKYINKWDAEHIAEKSSAKANARS